MRYAMVLLAAIGFMGCIKGNGDPKERPIIYSDADSDVQPPRLTHEVYPKTDNLNSREVHYGQLRFEVVIDDTGKAGSTKVLESVNPRWPELEQAYMEARRQSEYEPARKGTIPVWYRQIVTIRMIHKWSN
jgi:hypothetical protein